MPDHPDLTIKDVSHPAIFDPERVDRIIVNAGKVYPWQMNRKVCLCQVCRENQAAGRAMRFLRGYGQAGGNGYYCVSCLAKILRLCDWHWNPIEEELFPKRHFTQRPVSGKALADALLLEGERGLFTVILGLHKPGKFS